MAWKFYDANGVESIAQIGTVAITAGGTGAITAALAATALGVGAASTPTFAAVTVPTVTGASTITLDATTDIVLDADGADILLKDGGTDFGGFTNTSGNLIIKSGTTTAMTFSGANATIHGTLTVSGTTTTVDSTTLTVVDPIIHLQTATGGGALSGDTNKDVGIAMQYHNGSAAKNAFLGFDDSDGKLMFINDATITGGEIISNPTALGTIKANIEAATLSVTGVTTIRSIAYTWPASDGASGASLQTNASGTLSWTVAAAGVGLGMVIALGG